MQIFNQDVAAATGRKLTPPGPRVPTTDAIVEAEGLRAAVHAAAQHLERLSKLPAVAHWDEIAVAVDGDILVIDRTGSIYVNAASLHVMLEPAFNRLADKNPDLVESVGKSAPAAISGAQVGSVLDFLSTKVLGQFEPYEAKASGSSPRLMLVAPNVMMIR